MLRTILVPLDGSALSERALPYAIALARPAGAGLLLLRGIERAGAGPRPESEIDPATELDGLVDRAQAAGVLAEPYLYHLFFDDVGAVINGTAAKYQADLVVMSTHGRGGLGRWIYGSVADQVLREAQVPVLLVPATCEQAWPAERRPRLLVPLDGSDLSNAALTAATELAALQTADLHLLQVIQPASFAYAEAYAYVELDPEAERAEAERGLEKIAEPLRASGRNVQVHVVIGFPSSTIADVARELGADLIAMATHGRGGLARLVLGSVATGTLQRTTVPVLLVRPVQTSAPAQASEPEPAPAQLDEKQAYVPSVSISLTASELDLLERGLSELIYSPGADYQVARPVRSLLDRLKRAESALTALDGTEPKTRPGSVTATA